MIIRPTHTGTNPVSNTIAVPRQSSWHVPTGNYRATIRSANKKFRQGFSSSIPIVRLVLGLTVPGSSIDYLVKLDLQQDLNEGSDLWNVICRLKTRKALQDCSEAEFDLDSLVNTPCDVEIDRVNARADNYDFPFVYVADLREAGALVKEPGEPIPTTSQN